MCEGSDNYDMNGKEQVLGMCNAHAHTLSMYLVFVCARVGSSSVCVCVCVCVCYLRCIRLVAPSGPA